MYQSSSWVRPETFLSASLLVSSATFSWDTVFPLPSSSTDLSTAETPHTDPATEETVRVTGVPGDTVLSDQLDLTRCAGQLETLKVRDCSRVVLRTWGDSSSIYLMMMMMMMIMKMIMKIILITITLILEIY